MSYTIVDVGASKGEFVNFLNKLADIPALRIHAKEPISESLHRVSSNITKHNIGIGLKNETASLNIYSNSELSSFSKIKKDYDKNIWKHHAEGFNLKENRKIQVKTLEKFMIENSISEIDFLKVDIQGFDIDVIRSAKSSINKIKSFVVEVSYGEQYKLYEKNNSIDDLLSFVNSNNFFIYRIIPNGAGECNVFCINKDLELDWFQRMEELLKFDIAPCLKIDNFPRTSAEYIYSKIKKFSNLFNLNRQ